MEGLKDLLAPKTLHWFSYVANVCWFAPGTILSAIFLEIENNEPTDFRCGSNGDRELIGVKCYEQYEKQYNKFGIPVYGFVIINFLVTASVCGIYSQAVKSKVEELENPRNADDDVEGRTPRKKLFKAYCLQLLVRFALGVSFVLLQTKLLYPLSFPSNFNCNLTRDGNFSDITANGTRNGTQTQTSYECHNQRAAKKSFWSDAVIVVTGTFAFFVFIESLFMLLRAKKVKNFMEDPNFHKYYLSSNQQLNAPPTDNESLSEQQQREFNSPSVATFIERMKEHVRSVTGKAYADPAAPFHYNPGEGLKRDLKLDHIYTDLIIHENRALYEFSADREKQLKEYHRPREESRSTRPGDIFDADKRNILVVGRAGIGKTMICKKILRNWASDNLLSDAQKSEMDLKLAFLIKFRKFNHKNEELSLRKLLDESEYSKLPLSDEVWHYIIDNPDKVLVIFDGFDEYSGKAKINVDDISINNNVEDSMPLHFLYKKILSGKILPGATVLTTTRASAVSFFEAPIAFERIVEILGFNADKVEEYVDKFTKEKGDDGKGEAIKQHIRSNLNLQSFCYVPVNCFIICSCLLHLLDSPVSGCLPTRLTELYSIAIKIFYFCHDDIQNRYPLHEAQQFYLKPFNALPEHVQKLFKRLGEIAFQGIKEGRFMFESGEVDEQENNGLFHRLPDSYSGLTEGRAQYCFLHLTIQEFFAAKHLVDTYSSEDLQKFVSDHIQDGAWKFVMQFVAGLLAEKEGQSTDIFSDLLPSETFTQGLKIEMNEDSEERTLTFWPVPEHNRLLVVTLFNCMYENKASDREVQKKLKKIGCNALDFVHCKLSPPDCLALVHALKSVEGILYFDLSLNNLQSLGCIEIAKLLPDNQHNQGFCELKTLNLAVNNITDEGVKHLAKALTHTNCTLNILGLQGNNITDEAVKHLVTALTHTNCKLSSLNLGNNNITDEAVNHLSTALTHTNCNLNTIDLGGNNITDEGVEHLSTALTHANSKLNTLNLSRNNITDKAVKHLRTALTHTNCKLNRLDLQYNNITITDGCIKRFTGSTALTHTNCKRNKA
ncbi:unnamed protein product [Porites evermanni]|uniref:NACHT domain-containing protein n=1 Tax=Porites evermanni TaxID=104178 RepID=A0ABN8RYS5_9CNID|nr:unnamed protein product [Porites evermanni]